MFEHREWLKWKLLCFLVSKISNHSFLNLSWILWVQMAVISPPDVGCHVFSVGNFVTKNVFKPVRCSASMLWLITTVFRKPCHLCHLEISLNTFINCLPVDTINPHRLVMWFFFSPIPLFYMFVIQCPFVYPGLSVYLACVWIITCFQVSSARGFPRF